MYRHLQKDILNSNMVSSQYGELSSLTVQISWRVWGTPENFNGFRVSCFGSASLLHWRRSSEVEVNQTLHSVLPSPGLLHTLHYVSKNDTGVADCNFDAR